MLACYVPTPATRPRGEPLEDCMGQSILIYSRFWLHVNWSGLACGRPKVERAWVDRGLVNRGLWVEVRPERLTIMQKSDFDRWYNEHWRRFMVQPST